MQHVILIDFLLTVKAVTLIFISGRGSTISSAKQGESEASSTMRELTERSLIGTYLYS